MSLLDLDDELLTCADVVAILKVDPSTVWTWGQEGRLRAVRLGTGRRAPVRYWRSSVEELIAAGAVADGREE